MHFKRLRKARAEPLLYESLLFLGVDRQGFDLVERSIKAAEDVRCFLVHATPTWDGTKFTAQGSSTRRLIVQSKGGDRQFSISHQSLGSRAGGAERVGLAIAERNNIGCVTRRPDNASFE